MSRLREMAAALGGDVVGRDEVICPGPGHSPRDRSLSVRFIGGDDFVCNSFAGDDWRACRDHVRERLALPRAYQRDTASRRPAPLPDHGALARALWNEAHNPRGTLAETYLASRDLQLTGDIAGRVVRFHPSCPWTDGMRRTRVPAMLTPFRPLAKPDTISGIQRIALTPCGKKMGRRMLGPCGGSAIMLDDDDKVTLGLTIAEGLETALSGRQLGWRPAWALGSAHAIATFPVLGGIECLTVLAEHDDSGANARALFEMSQRWNGAGREILIVSPRFGGDANDALRGVTP
jgi:putative DNA primase/helicase